MLKRPPRVEEPAHAHNETPAASPIPSLFSFFISLAFFVIPVIFAVFVFVVFFSFLIEPLRPFAPSGKTC
jgi:hypothetical protein